MSERKIVQMTISMEDIQVERLKSQLRTAGHANLSATMAVAKAVELYQQEAGSVRLNPPERSEIESRSAANTPIRQSKDILRAFERMVGDENTVLIQMSAEVGIEIRRQAREMGVAYSDLCKMILDEGFVERWMAAVELQPLYFKPPVFKALLSALNLSRITSGEQLLAEIIKLRGEASHFSGISAQASAETKPTIASAVITTTP